MKTGQSRAPRRARFAALALTGAAASIMILPVGLGVACASTIVPTVEAGGAPPKPVKHVTQTRYVTREKPVLRSPRMRLPRVDVIVDNYNDNFNRHHRFRRQDLRRELKHDFKHDFKHDNYKKADPYKSVEQVTPEYDEYDEYNKYGNQYDNVRPGNALSGSTVSGTSEAGSGQAADQDKYWWPGSKQWKNWN
ncbi:hypothetical protein SMD20_07880 [Nonomuraea sp. LP-02]|uniref:hypothetical protein n=1 Tax=Nonomuraea sp. LP-02 TaxID=3097960 RepID=UPI002E3219E2|nr:hypothetical protein [Nonomuraea sp. LP-02]MED7924146.1 hypothetical protein [Nonomuraea sp. LP-02]